MKIPDIDFPQVSSDEWRKQIIKDLRGIAYEELIRKNKDGIEISPIYHPDTSIPESIRQAIHAVQPPNDSWRLNRVFREGQSDILPWIERAEKEGIKSIEFKDLKDLKQIDYAAHSIEQLRLHLNEDGVAIPEVLEVFKTSNIDSINLYINRLKRPQYAEWEALADRLYLVPASKYAEIGASATTELAIALSWAHEYFIELLQNNIQPARAAQLIEIQLASGTDFFTEIAKFRAIRVLWGVLTSKYEIEHPTLHVSSISSRWYFTANDEHTNLLRTTAQTMSAILGGSQTLTVLPFNGTGDVFSERIASNIGNILEHESYFKKLHDPSYGSHYLDYLTYQIIQIAWKRATEIENAGGFSVAKNAGLIKRMFKEDSEREVQKVLNGSQTLLGVNKFPNPNNPTIESILVDSLERAYFEAK